MPIRIYDDQRLTKDVTYFGNQWTTTVRDNAYLGTVLECDATNVVNATGQDAPYLEMTFRGSTISFIGQRSTDLRLNYSLDHGATQEEAVLSPVTPETEKNGALVWKLDTPGPGYDRVRVYPHAGRLTLDYMSYFVANEDEFILGSNVMVSDDRDQEEILWSGLWDVYGVAESGPLPRLPSDGTWTQSKTNGSAFYWSFDSTEVAVFGYLNHAPGVLKVQYELGHNTKNYETITHFDGSQTVNSSHWEWTELFRRELDPGDHRFAATIVELTESQSFNVDFVTYRAATQAEIQSAQAAAKKGISPGAIAGAVVGSVVVLALIIACFFWFDRSVKRHTKASRAETGTVLALRRRNNAAHEETLPPYPPATGQEATDNQAKTAAPNYSAEATHDGNVPSPVAKNVTPSQT